MMSVQTMVFGYKLKKDDYIYMYMRINTSRYDFCHDTKGGGGRGSKNSVPLTIHIIIISCMISIVAGHSQYLTQIQVPHISCTYSAETPRSHPILMAE